MITELESLQTKNELEIENKSLREENKRLNLSLVEANIKNDKLSFELRRKLRREFVPVPSGN